MPEEQANWYGCSDLDKGIVRQIEYYFGDYNLHRDKFLQEKIKDDNDGWVPLSVMLTFNRLKSMTEDPKVIVSAIEKVGSDIIEVSEGGEKIRRNPKNPLESTIDEYMKLSNNRSVYCKGFPYDASLDDVVKFFEQFGKTDTVYMRRLKDKQFKGSVFVMFKEDEVAKTFLDLPSVKYNDNELIKMARLDYVKQKAEMRKEIAQSKAKDKEENLKIADEKERKNALKAMVKGSVFSVENLPTKNISCEKIKVYFQAFGEVEWIDWFNTEGRGKAKVRTSMENGAAEMIENLMKAGNGVTKYHDTEITCKVLQDEEEIEHWRGVVKMRQSRANQSKHSKRTGVRGKKRRNIGHGGPRAKRRQNDESDSSDVSEECSPKVHSSSKINCGKTDQSQTEISENKTELSAAKTELLDIKTE